MREADLEADVNDGTNEQQLEHEVIEGLLEELPIRCALRRLLPVSAKMGNALVKVHWGETLLQVCLQLVGKCRKTYRFRKSRVPPRFCCR